VTSKREIEIATSLVVKNSFFRYFFNRKPIETKHVLLSRLYPQESITGSAIVGLQTSLGTTLWENLAKNLAEKNGFEVRSPKESLLKPNKIPKSAENLIGEWARRREESTTGLPLSEFTKLMKLVVAKEPKPKSFSKLGKGSGADLYFVKNGIKYVFDVKTVQLNAGSGSKYNRTLMEWITFDLFQNGVKSKMLPALAIPYDPTEFGDWWRLFQGRVAPLDHEDVRVGNEFWDLVSGCKNSLSVITNTFDELAKSNFGKHYGAYLTDYSNLAKVRHIEYHFACIFVGRIPDALSTKAKYHWQCMTCSEKYLLSMNKIFSLNHVCGKKTCVYTKSS
jgi:hypothetical protein